MIRLLTLVLVFSSLSSYATNASNICVNDRVIDEFNDVGTVVEIFSNGKVNVRFDGWTSIYTRKISSLGRAVSCHSGFCVNNRVIDTSNEVGTIRELFDNGKSKVKLDGWSALYTRTLSTLGRGYSCVGDACVNDRVIDIKNDVGTIKEVFNNGKAKVKLDGWSALYTRTLRDLGYAVDCSSDQPCSGRN